MSLGPTATSVIQPYGLPSCLATEQQVAAKTARKTAPVALEVNGEGVIQADGLSTRGMTMFGGPLSITPNVTLVQADNVATVALSAAQFVDGVCLVFQGSAVTTIQFPNLADVAQFMNSRLVTTESAIAVAGTSTTNSPRSSFRFRVFSNAVINVSIQAANTYFWMNWPAVGADATIAALPVGPTQINFAAIANGYWLDFHFFQNGQTAAGTPVWAFVLNPN